jgi:hypothetical protein
MRTRKHFQVIFHSAHRTNKPRDQFPTSFTSPEVEKIFQDFQIGTNPGKKLSTILKISLPIIFIAIPSLGLVFLLYKIPKSKRQAKWREFRDRFAFFSRTTIGTKPRMRISMQENTIFSAVHQNNNTGSGSLFSPLFMIVNFRPGRSTRNSQHS